MFSYKSKLYESGSKNMKVHCVCAILENVHMGKYNNFIFDIHELISMRVILLAKTMY